MSPRCAARGDFIKEANIPKRCLNSTKGHHSEPKLGRAYSWRGFVYNRLGRFAEAIPELGPALKINPKNTGPSPTGAFLLRA